MSNEIKFEKTRDKHHKYDEFEIWQLQAEIPIGETIIIEYAGKKYKYKAKFINCHINAVIQDKGIKTFVETD